YSSPSRGYRYAHASSSYSYDARPSPSSSSAPPPIPPNPYLQHSSSRTPYSSPPPPPGALPPARPVTPPMARAEFPLSHVQAGYASGDAAGPGTSPTSPESERAWRESRIISMYGSGGDSGGGTGSVTNSPSAPASPRLGSISGGRGDYFRSSFDLTPPPASSVPDPVSSSSAAYARSPTQPAYPAYAAARAASTSSTYSYRGVDASSGKRPSNPPPLSGTFRPRGSRTSEDSVQYSVYSYHSNDSGPSAVVGPPPVLGARNNHPSSPAVPERKQSLEHVRAMQQQHHPQGQGPSPNDNHRPRYDSSSSSHYSSYSVPGESTVPQIPPLPLSSTSPIYPTFFASSVSAPPPAPRPAPPPAPPPAPRSRQPTILMSPPLDANPECPDPLHRNRSIDSTWSRSISSSSFQSHPTFSTVPTSPGPSPSLSQSFSFSSDISRRPSQATLSPIPSSLEPSPYLLRAESGDSFSSSAPSPNAVDGAEFLNPAFLSDLAVFVKDRVPRGPRQKGAVEHWGFTGDEVISALVQALPSSSNAGSLAPPPPSVAGSAAVVGADGGTAGRERKLALGIAKELHRALWFHEVDWDDAPLKDSRAQVFAFLQDEREASGRRDDEADREEIPTGVITELTKCYSPFCRKENAAGAMTPGGVLGACYAYSCPNRQNAAGLQRVGSTLSAHSASAEPQEEADNWATSVPRAVLESLDKKQIAYQNQVFELIHGEQKYYDDLMLIETAFVEPLWTAQPPIMPPDRLPSFLSSVLLNISTIRLHSRAFLDALRAKQAEAHVVGGIGRLVLAAAVEWGPAYIQFTVGFPMADWCFKEEKRANPRFNELLM
ncbi:hypothetical protein JCM21900_003491, partial [Sporobolomyces salmonicolor]